MNKSDLYDAPHVGIVGSTGSGKTTFSIHLYENVPTGKGIFIHQDPNDRMDFDVRIDYSRGDTWTVEKLKENRLIEVVMPPNEEHARMELAQIQADLFTIGRQLPHDNPRFYVFVDEAHEYADLNAEDDNPLVRMAKRGRRHNIRLFIISQSPADVSKKALKQANYHAIFAMGTFSKSYFDTYHIPFEEVRDKVGKPDSHKFLIWDDFELWGPFKLPPENV